MTIGDSMRSWIRFFCLGVLTLISTGCPDRASEQPARSGPPAGATLRVLVVDDPALGESIGYLKSEWEAQSGVGLAVEQAAAGPFNAGATPAADVVIGPSHLLGPVAEAGWAALLPAEVIQNNLENWSDIFAQLRSHEVAWKGEFRAVPFGSPVAVVYYRADLLEKAGRQPPATWADYQATAKALSGAAVIEPLAEGWAGVFLLARAAAYASHRDNLSTLFSISTMEPLVAGPPFVRALEELAASVDKKSLEMDPAAVRRAFWQGEAGMAVTWPTAADASLAEVKPDFAAGVTALPGARDVFDVGDGQWETRAKGDAGRIPLLGVAGRLGMVSTASQWPETAWQLLLWLTDEKWSVQVCAASPATTLFRHAHLAEANAWVERPMTAEAATQYAECVAAALEGRQHLFALRIAGRRDYLAALDAAVRSAVEGENPQQALGDAAARWREITEQLGVERQKAAYRASLGLD
jgi:multiple sugar transport system substrate-binding protein